MKSEPLHNEIPVTKIKSISDCEKHIKMMKTKPQTSNLLTNLTQQDRNSNTVILLPETLFLAVWKVTWIMYEVIDENSHAYSHGLTRTSLMRKELCPSLILTKWYYLTLLLTFNHVYCISTFHIGFFLIGFSVTNIFGVTTSSWRQNCLLQTKQNKLKVERF